MWFWKRRLLNTPAKIAGKRVAVLFSGGPAAGGHNVLAGLKAVLGKDNTLLGIRKGPKGLINGDVFEIDCRQLEDIVNTGGFDFLGTDRTKIKTPQQFEKVKETVVKNKLDGLVIVGGDDSNTNAAFIAEYLEREGRAMQRHRDSQDHRWGHGGRKATCRFPSGLIRLRRSIRNWSAI